MNPIQTQINKEEECDDNCEECKDEGCPLQGDKIITWIGEDNYEQNPSTNK